MIDILLLSWSVRMFSSSSFISLPLPSPSLSFLSPFCLSSLPSFLSLLPPIPSLFQSLCDPSVLVYSTVSVSCVFSSLTLLLYDPELGRECCSRGHVYGYWGHSGFSEFWSLFFSWSWSWLPEAPIELGRELRKGPGGVEAVISPPLENTHKFTFPKPVFFFFRVFTAPSAPPAVPCLCSSEVPSFLLSLGKSQEFSKGSLRGSSLSERSASLH